MPRPPSLPTTTAPDHLPRSVHSPHGWVVRVLGVFLLAMVLLGFGAAGMMTATAMAQTTAALPSAPPRTAVVDARLGIHPDKTRFVLELSDPVSFSVSVAADPYRVIVDLPDLIWPGGSLPVEGKGVVARYHHAGGPRGTRLTFETVGPARLREGYMIPARDGHQPRLVLDLEKATPAEFRQLAAGGKDTKEVGGKGSLTMSSILSSAMAVPAPVPAPQPSPPAATESTVSAPPPFVPLPPIPPAQLIPAALPAAPPPPENKPPTVAEKPLIVLDPGHGGQDPGAIGVGGIYEKDITLATAKEVKRQLEATGRYRVKLTRDSDVFIRLRDRVAIGREAGADLFISLHADSISSGDMRGLSIYTLSDKASDREAEMLAAKENRADALVGLDLSGENQLVANILIDLAQRDTMNHSKRFATLALQALGRDVPLISNRPHRQAGFAVLTAPDVPSALIEMGYLSNRQDVGLLTSGAHRERLGKGLARTIDNYFRWLHGSQRS
ncbi:N-acetylmuramoyl-L-alanine amidase [Azospirillum lipoferum]|uniref:N-acetylmuramoyl-L-alanine amidase n=1 Tax=Azospirillum lipoferum TaxID=193 RepID=A0A5A9GEI3_AZOLI|nr:MULTISPECIES: N-acetylmuramoyl-L-alanine amidase [Azospirillum]KAA0591719.1 N-acetylmuramoyl-L-alanine amidase [Azospirillum lipoferum]MCP1614892.1 N-acetylmuramoyl-L-alanine amidase [Azospirillum lipoferum]MDW5536357.1 N-acetylmuramoyl-L-alanine amidase [Azospirillum sp. NL1]